MWFAAARLQRLRRNIIPSLVNVWLPRPHDKAPWPATFHSDVLGPRSRPRSFVRHLRQAMPNQEVVLARLNSVLEKVDLETTTEESLKAQLTEHFGEDLAPHDDAIQVRHKLHKVL
jgi:hypothetical protein